jgi:hypothetical protein
MSAPKPVSRWDIDDVVAFLGSIGLPQLGDSFRANAVNGKDLSDLSDEDFKESLGCTALQVKKIRRELQDFGVGATAGTGSGVGGQQQPASVDTPTPVAAAPEPAASGGGDKAAALSAEIAQLESRANEVQSGAQAYAAGQQYLRKAEAQLKSASGSLTVTQVSGATNMLQDIRRPGGAVGFRRGPLERRNDFAHNVIEIGTVHKANAMMKEAAQNIEAARRHLPNLPFIKPANIKQAMSGVFFNALLAPGLVGDVMQNAAVRKSKAQVQEMLQEVVQALDWCTNNMTAAQAEAAQIRGSLQAKQSELSSLSR